MRRNTISFIVLMITIVMMGACGNNAWDELPSPIAKFVSEYFPYGEVASYVVTDKGSTVKIRNGAELTFDTDYNWTKVNGRGATLPQQFIYDQLPSELYDYLEAIETDEGIYCVTRDGQIIVVELLDSKVEYDGTTGTISYPSAPLHDVLNL
ncbi:MAG: PepSY-like domain-containing protein [Paramuribaculum sp.]|nr:PepSY-like domain-containing protein [Paramuribaculum sp.]